MTATAMEWTPLVATNKAVGLFSLTSRQQALKEPGVGHAAHLIKDSVIGHQDAPYDGYFDPYQDEQSVLSTISVICGRLVVQLRGLVVFCSWVLFMLTFFEPPNWCRDASHLQIVMEEGEGENYSTEYGDCKLLLSAQGTTADNQANQELYPNTSTMLLTIYQSKFIELVCISLITLYVIFAFADDGFKLHLFFYSGKKRWIHSMQCLVLLCLVLCTIYDITIYKPFLRMLILGSFLRRFQRELFTFLKMIPDLMLPLSLLAIIVLFYAWFGVVIFYETKEGSSAFPNLAEGMWTLWICITTANYPDVMMPAYNENRVVAIYFISFMTLSFFYIMNLILAVAVNAYDESINERKRAREEMTKVLLLEAFTLLDHNNENVVSRKSIMHVMTILNQDIPEIRGLSRDEEAILFAILDRDGSNTISRDEFLNFGLLLLLSLSKRSEYVTFVEAHLPKMWNSPVYQALCKTVRSKRFDKAVEIVLVLNAIIVAAQDYPMLAGVSKDPHYLDGIDTKWEAFETVFTIIYVIETMLKIMVNGWRSYIEKPRNAFDFTITVLVVLASFYVYYPNTYSNRDLIEFVAMARVLRLCRLLFALDRFRIFGLISLVIIPAASSVFLVLLFLGYLFASLGMILFGGVITRDPSNPISLLLLEAEDFVEGEYWANSFNDMASSINVLFNWLVINNWTTQTSGLEYASESKWLTRLFFFSFYLLGVIGISNVITSVVINSFLQQLQTVEQRAESLSPEKIGDDEDITITSSQAMFNPTKITGTTTGICQSSDYFARIKPTHMDVEVDAQAALRRLFTSGSSSDK